MKTIATEIQPQLRGLLQRVAAVRRRELAVRMATGLALALSVFVGVLGAEMLLDWLVKLPWLGRAVILLLTLGGAGWFAWRDVIVPWRTPPDDDAVACSIERALPGFDTRLIASIQLARAEAGRTSAALLRALLAETTALAAKANFGYVVKTARLQHALRIALAIFLAAGVLGWLGGDDTPRLVERALLSTRPLPAKTRLLSVTGNRQIGVGQNLTIEAVAGGILPDAGRVSVTFASGATREFALEREPQQPARYSAVVRCPQESFTYVVQVHDAASSKFQVEVRQAPAVAAVECEEIFPAYVRRPPARRTTGDLTLLAGSTLDLRIKTTAAIRSATLRPEGAGAEVPLEVDAQNRRELRGRLPIPAKDLTGFSIHLIDETGVESGEPTIYRIELLPDRAPSVRLTYPRRREELATAQATPIVAFTAEDDFGVAKAALHYRVDGGAEKIVALNLPPEPARSVMRRFDWKIRATEPGIAAGVFIEFWIEVADANDINGPGRGASEHHQMKIVTEEEKRADLGNRLSEVIGGLSEVTTSQEQLNKNLGEVIFEKQPALEPRK